MTARRTSIKSAAAIAKREDAAIRRKITADAKPKKTGLSTVDSFVNFQYKLGIGADNPLSSSSYGFNPITRNRTQLEWIHRGSWLGGVAIDLVANDMTRAGIDFVAELDPQEEERIDQSITTLQCWTALNEVIRWGRLYGGAICVALIDGQDLRTPLRLETVGMGQFKGLLTLDRWMVEPTLEDLVTDLGPHLGLPKYYRVNHNAPALRGAAIHHSRVVVRHVGLDIPYQQRMMENLWGISVLERLYDRMIAFDSASTGAAQLVYKSYLRTFKVKGLREVVAQGGAALDGLSAYVEQMRRYQSIESISMIDLEDEFEVQGHSAFSGIGDVLTQLKEQICGALEIPATRLFGVSGGGLNGTNDGDMRLYYDSIKQQQQKVLHHGVTVTYKLAAASNGVQLPPNFAVAFRSLWELTDTDKAAIAKQVGETVGAAHDAALISPQVALKELRQSSRRTGIFTNITQEIIEEADDQVGPPPMPEGMPGQPGDDPNKDPNEDGQDEAQGEGQPVGQVPRRRVAIQQPAQGGGTANRPPRQGTEPNG